MTNRASCLAPSNNRKRQSANSRRGSALLIVLGMLAFMIVSAVAFSAYMRYSRLPSSFLRRTAASRQLVKAALARAIDEIDASIGNNPHPGVGVAETRYPRNTDSSKGAVGRRQLRNLWLHRVFFGTNSYCSVDDTVSPLTLEALAYIPPPLVNEARYLSRLSPAAAWKSLGFDAGRYAFCALDVSDYFDINRLTASAPRSSAGNRRISLGYAFENDAHTSPGSDAKSWDAWMDNYRTFDNDLRIEWSGSKAPLVSMADFNLAFGDKGGIGKMVSPFWKFIEDGDRNTFYAASGDADYDRYNRMTFVTDGFFPPENDTAASAAEKAYELADPQYQPFKIDPNGGSVPNIDRLLMGSEHRNEGTMAWHKRLGGVGLAALYDYLDPDHVPVSLAVPTVERVPMICGVEPVLNGAKFAVTKKFKFDNAGGEHGDQDANAVGTAGQTRRCTQEVEYRIDPNALNLTAGAVNAVTVYPFCHDAEYSEKFELDGRISFFLSTEQMGLRTGNSNPNTEVLHVRDKGNMTSGVDANGLMNVALTGSLPFDTKNAPKTEQDAVKDITLPFMSGGAANLGSQLNGQYLLLRVKYVWEQTYSKEYGSSVGGMQSLGWGPLFSKTTDWLDNTPEYSSDLCIMDGSGRRQTDIKRLVERNQDLYFNMAVWLRIKQGNDVVDMAPACLGDDNIQKFGGGAPNAFDMLNGGDFGQYYPLLRFDTAGQGRDVTFKFSPAALDALATTPADIQPWPQAAVVADPRFNHAPENWFAVNSGLSKSSWLDSIRTPLEDGDGDIFMEVSDNGYMQSKYELAMLPACATLRHAGSPSGMGKMKLFTTYNGRSLPSSFSNTVQGNWMWKTYDPLDDAYFDEFNAIHWVGDKAGYRVNPYSDSTNVIMAAFANTPLNWACAGTNDVDNAVNFTYSDPKNPNGAAFNKKYAWNEYNTNARFGWGDLQKVAGSFMAAVRGKNGNWEDAWDSLDWYGTDDSFCGVTLSSNTDGLWNVDRKFLYGYWKECFAAKQQLFLVFVRAEPVMMGGGGMGQIPPQLGARAVALVWRNPATTDRDGKALPEGTPHQTRVLFYRQLD